MPEYLSPGVYIEEVDRGTKPIESVGTSTLGILGVAGKGPRNEPTLITNWSQYTRVFGEFGESPYLAHAVYGFFLNGGTRCFVVNVAPEYADCAQAARASNMPLKEVYRAALTAVAGLL